MWLVKFKFSPFASFSSFSISWCSIAGIHTHKVTLLSGRCWFFRMFFDSDEWQSHWKKLFNAPTQENITKCSWELSKDRPKSDTHTLPNQYTRNAAHNTHARATTKLILCSIRISIKPIFTHITCMKRKKNWRETQRRKEKDPCMLNGTRWIKLEYLVLLLCALCLIFYFFSFLFCELSEWRSVRLCLWYVLNTRLCACVALTHWLTKK